MKALIIIALSVVGLLNMVDSVQGSVKDAKEKRFQAIETAVNGG